MRSNVAGGLVALLGLVILIGAYGSLFTVYQTDQAIVVQFGEPVRVVTEPGLHFKWPLVQSVISIDKRILDLENSAQEVIAFDQKRLVVDAFARYRVSDPLRFYQTIGAIEGANARLSTLLNSALRRVLGGSEKLVYDSGPSGQGVVPYLPLSELTAKRAPATGQQTGGGNR